MAVYLLCHRVLAVAVRGACTERRRSDADGEHFQAVYLLYGQEHRHADRFFSPTSVSPWLRG